MRNHAKVPSAVAVAFRVLEAVASLQPVGVSTLARHLDLPKSTVQRSLVALDVLGYVYGSGEVTRWSLSMRSVRLGSKALESSVSEQARPDMERLLVLTDEAVHLTVLDGREVIVIEKLDGRQAVRAYTEMGERLPAHSSATGKAILAASGPDVVEEFLATPLKASTERTIVDPARFRQELDAIRRRGYSINDGERRIDVAAVGAAILDSTGQPVAGIGVAAPKHRFDRARMEVVAADVVEAAERVAMRLGHDRDGVDPPPESTSPPPG